MSGLSHHGVSCTLQCKFTLRITHGAPLTTRLLISLFRNVILDCCNSCFPVSLKRYLKRQHEHNQGISRFQVYDKRRKSRERLGVLLSNFISALKKSTQTPLSKRSSVRAKVGGEASCSLQGFCVKQRNAYYAEYSKQI